MVKELLFALLSSNDLIICPNIKWLTVNDYPPSSKYDYTIIHKLEMIEHLSIYTNDKKEIEYSKFPNLKMYRIDHKFSIFHLLENYINWKKKQLKRGGRLRVEEKGKDERTGKE